MKRRSLLSLSFIIFLLAPLTSCHGSKESVSFDVPDTFDTTKQLDITFWAKNDSNREQKAIYNNAAKSFEELYPNVKVTIKSYSDYTQIYNDVVNNISTNTTPNVCITYPDHIATYLTGKNVIVPLDELVDDPKYGLGGSELKFASVSKDNIISKFYDEGKIDNVQYALPFMRSSEAVYINKDYVERLGYKVPDILTWDFIWEVCEKAMENKEPNSTLIPMIYKSTDNMFIQMAKQLDIDYTTDDGQILLFNDDTKDLLLDLKDKANKKLFDTFKRVSYPGNFLNAGQCIFAIDSTAGATWMGAKAPLMDIPSDQVVDFETVVRPVPQYDVSNPQMISQGPSICIFNKEDPQEVLASFMFAQYLLTFDTQFNYCQTEGYVPVTSEVVNSKKYQDYLNDPSEYDVKIAASKLVIDNVDNTFVTPVFNGSSLVRSASGYLIEQIFTTKLENDENIKELYSNTISLYKMDEYMGNKGDIRKQKLPAESVALLVTLGTLWTLLLAYFVYKRVKKAKII